MPTSRAARHVPPPRPLTADGIEILTIPEVADLFRVNQTTVNMWIRRRVAGSDPDRKFPVEDDHAGRAPIWRLNRLLLWADLTGRPDYEDEWRTRRDAGGYWRPDVPPAARVAAAKAARAAAQQRRRAAAREKAKAEAAALAQLRHAARDEETSGAAG